VKHKLVAKFSSRSNTSDNRLHGKGDEDTPYQTVAKERSSGRKGVGSICEKGKKKKTTTLPRYKLGSAQWRRWERGKNAGTPCDRHFDKG